MPNVSQTEQPSFKWINNTNPNILPYITVDIQKRLFFSKASLKLLNANPKRTGLVPVNIGYDFANKRLVIADPNVVRPANVKPHHIDKRSYTSARPFIREVGLDKNDLPIRFIYLGKDYGGGLYPNGSHVFGLNGEFGGDGGL